MEQNSTKTYSNVTAQLKAHEMLRLKTRAQRLTPTPFAKFCNDLSGLQLYYGTTPIDKWEGFYITKGKSEPILKKNSLITFKEKD